MRNFKQIDKSEVWSHLQEGKDVYAVIFKSNIWREGLKELWHNWSACDINELLLDKEKNIAFFERIGK
jgi:hypothetical protein